MLGAVNETPHVPPRGVYWWTGHSDVNTTAICAAASLSRQLHTNIIGLAFLSNSLCLFVAEEHGVRYGHSNSDDDDDDDKFFLGISHGAYAGIVCGVLFVACVALLVALHYRKRYLV